MELIDRYVYAVTERLPEDMREDVSRELRANIEDMLPENPAEKDVREVLEKLGNPVKLANEYSPKKRYLVGPDLYDKYISVLKLVTGIIAAVVVFSTLLSEIFNPRPDDAIVTLTVSIITNVIVSVVEGIMQGFVLVTIVFAVLERTGATEGRVPFANKKWSVDDLAQMPVGSKKRIPKREIILSMALVVFFTAVIYFKPEIIAAYIRQDNGSISVIPFFMNDRLGVYALIILLVAILQLGVLTWKFISGQWIVPIAIAGAVVNLAFCAVIFIMAGDSSLFNKDFVTALADSTKISLNEVSMGWSWFIKMFAVVFIAANLWDSINGFLKCRR